MSLVVERSVCCVYQYGTSNQEFLCVDHRIRACECMQIHMSAGIEAKLPGTDFSDDFATGVMLNGVLRVQAFAQSASTSGLEASECAPPVPDASEDGCVHPGSHKVS